MLSINASIGLGPRVIIVEVMSQLVPTAFCCLLTDFQSLDLDATKYSCVGSLFPQLAVPLGGDETLRNRT